MALRRTEVNTEEKQQETKNPEAETWKAEKEEWQKELEELRERNRQYEIKQAKAEGEAEALRRSQSQQTGQAPQWTDEQWEAEAMKHGMTGQQLKAQIEIARGVSEMTSKPLRQELENAVKEAREAKEELNKYKARGGRDSVKENFLNKNPALKTHRGLVDDFLSTYGDNETVDDKTYQKRLEFASDYVKGKVKDTMRTKTQSETGSMRFEGSEGNEDPNDIPSEFDPRGVGSEGGKITMSRVMNEFGQRSRQGLKREDSIEVWKKSQDEEGRGVAISMDEDLEVARRLEDRQHIGGTRGARYND